MTLTTYKRYGIYTGVALVVLVGLFFLIKFIVHQATMERPHYNSGKIVQRDYSPAHTDMVPQQRFTGETCETVNKVEECTPHYMMVLVPVYYPSSWSIQIENCNVHHKDGSQWVDKKTGAAKCFSKWVGVDETAYNSKTTQMGVVWGVPGT
jgi:hypothetical protein